MIVGIDLGTTNSAIAYINKDGKPEIIPNREGDRTTPSVLLFEGNGKVIVGKIAKDNAMIDPINVVSFIKSEMGNSEYRFIHNGKEYTPEELSAFVLKKLKEDAEAFLGKKIEKAVVTVPAYFSDAQRKATQDAGKLIGLDIVKIINEPTAAALSYGLLNSSKEQNIIVYDLGGGTFDATIVNIKDSEIVVKATDGIRELGGRDFDDKVIEYVLDLFHTNHGIDLEDEEYASVYQDLRNRVEECKRQLSFKEETLLYINCNGIGEKVTLTRSQFEKMIRPLYKRTEIIVENVIKQAEMTWNDINKILLVGGSTRIPFIYNSLKQISGIEPSREVHPDEAVAMGAAVQAAMLDKNITEINKNKVKIIDVCSHSIGLISIDYKTDEKVNTIILKRNSQLPATDRKTFYTAVENQKAIKLLVTEGETKDVDYVNIIGEFEIKLPPRLPKETEVEIEITIDENQIIHVFARIPSVESFFKEMHINRRANLNNEEINNKKDIISKIDIE